MGPHELEGKCPEKGKISLVVKTADAIGDSVVNKNPFIGGTYATVPWKPHTW